jgi:hypothetical protein
MASWEDIANEVAPPGAPAPGLATGAQRSRKRGQDLGASLGAALGATRFLECPPAREGDAPDAVWQGGEVESGVGSFYFIDPRGFVLRFAKR